MEKLLLRVHEAAELLGISRAKAYELVAQGTLPAMRLGSSVRVPAEQLRHWVREESGRQNHILEA